MSKHHAAVTDEMLMERTKLNSSTSQTSRTIEVAQTLPTETLDQAEAL